MIQLAWLWLRHQPDSALARWFHERVTRNSGRLRKTTLVALARKLLVALWKYVHAGVVIEGHVEIAGENRLTGAFPFAKSANFFGRQRVNRRQARLIKFPHGLLVHQTGGIQVLGGFMD
jgi:hypothetical protein